MERLREFVAVDALQDSLNDPAYFNDLTKAEQGAVLNVAYAMYIEADPNAKQRYATFIQHHTGQTPQKYQESVEGELKAKLTDAIMASQYVQKGTPRETVESKLGRIQKGPGEYRPKWLGNTPSAPVQYVLTENQVGATYGSSSDLAGRVYKILFEELPDGQMVLKDIQLLGMS